jgi:hypothetical protein
MNYLKINNLSSNLLGSQASHHLQILFCPHDLQGYKETALFSKYFVRMRGECEFSAYELVTTLMYYIVFLVIYDA